MDSETKVLLNTVAQQAATEAVAKMREFHQEDLRALGERVDIGFAKVERELKDSSTRLDQVERGLTDTTLRLDGVEGGLINTTERLDRIENALATLLNEFKSHQEKQQKMEAQIAALTERVALLEKQLAHAK